MPYSLILHVFCSKALPFNREVEATYVYWDRADIPDVFLCYLIFMLVYYISLAFFFFLIFPSFAILVNLPTCGFLFLVLWKLHFSFAHEC